MKELSKAIQQQNIVIGSNEVRKALKNGELSKIYLCNNCSGKLKEEFEQFSKLNETKIQLTKKSSADFGILCKRQYNIQVIGIKK